MTRSGRELARLRDAYARRRERGLEDRYAPFEPANLLRTQTLERACAGALRAGGLLPWRGGRALDVGCGGGWWLRTLLRWGAPPSALAGIDALPDAARAAQGVHPLVGIARGSADALPFPDESFNLVSQFTVFSSILDEGVRRRAAAEMARVLRPGGMLLWYDFTANPFNRDTRGIGAREAAALFPDCHVTVTRLTLAPPLARLVTPRSWLLATLLETLPPLRTHILMTVRARATPASPLQAGC